MFEKTRPETPARARNCYSESQAREIGRRLREARLARRMDLATLAECTFTRPSDLEALEQGEFDRVAGRIHLPVFLRVYGDHLRLDGEELARPREASTGSLAPAPAPKPRERTSGSRRRAATTMAASLLLGAAAAGYYASHRLGPGAVEATAEAAPPMATPPPHGGAGRTDDDPPAAPTSAGVPGPAPVAAVDAIVPDGGEPPAGSVTEQEPATPASLPVVEPSSADEPPAPEGLGEPAPDLAAAPGGGSPEGGHAGVTRPAAPGAADAGSIGPSPDTTADAMEEPVASGEPALLDAPASPATAAEPTTAPAARAEAAPPPAGRFAIYFFSVRPSARVSREWRRLTERHPDLAGLELRPTRPVAIPGKGTFYRIEAGAFATRAEAQAVCDRLRSRGQACRVLAP